MKIYISGKITGDLNWVQKFNDAEKYLLETYGNETVIFNPTLTKMYEGKISYDDFMHVDFAFIDISDIIYMLSDWQSSKGANLEYNYAILKGKQILFEEIKMEEEKKIILNGKELTESQFDDEKKKLEEKKIEIVQIENGVYKTRLKD